MCMGPRWASSKFLRCVMWICGPQKTSSRRMGHNGYFKSLDDIVFSLSTGRGMMDNGCMGMAEEVWVGGMGCEGMRRYVPRARS